MTPEQKRRKLMLMQMQQAQGESADPDMSFMGRVKDNIVGVDDGVMSPGEKIGSLLNKAGESMTMGLVGDEASAAVESLIPGVNYEDRRDHYREQERTLEDQSPGLSLAADIGGAMVMPGGIVAKAGGNIGARALASGVGTGIMGGVYGFMEGEGGAQSRAEDAKHDGMWSGGIGAVIPVAGAGFKRLADALVKRNAFKAAARNAPTTEQLRQMGQEAYRAIDDAGVRVKPERVSESMQSLAQAMRSQGAGFQGAEKVLPASRAIMEAAEGVGRGQNSVPWQELDVFRRYLGASAGSNLGNKADTRNATGALAQFDDFIQGLSPDDVDAGDVDTLKTMLPKAREVWANMSRSQTIDDAIEASGNYASGPASGIRNQFRRILNSPQLSRGFSEAEKKLMKRVVNGGIGDTITHYLGGGLGMLATMSSGAVMGGLPGAIIGAGAAGGARKLSERTAMKHAEMARAIIANGGLPALPSSSPQRAQLIEQLMRRATSAGVQR